MEQMDSLMERQCYEMQGYLFSKLPPHLFEELLGNKDAVQAMLVVSSGHRTAEVR